MSDRLENQIPPVPTGSANIPLGEHHRRRGRAGADHDQLWRPRPPELACLATQPQPIEAVLLDFDPVTTEGRLTSMLRP